MRLTCPNCGARYEVDDGLIPPEGRDVQCSNCATTWFQPGRHVEPTVEPDEAEPAPGAETEMPAPPAPEEAMGPDAPAGTRADAGEAVAEDPAAAGPSGPKDRRAMDPGVRDILREEAEREARLRRGEPDPVETQSEMPLDVPSDSDNRARRRAERETELEDAQDAFDVASANGDAQAESARRDLLPDIEEINSTLRATGDRAANEEDASDIETVDHAARRRQGVRVGFGLTVMFAAILAWIYVNEGRVIDWIPAAEPLVEGYVGLIDRARFGLDDMARSLVGSDDAAQ